MLIYSSHTPPRLQYILKFIFDELLGMEYSFTHDREEWLNYDGARINYSLQSEDVDCLWIPNVDLLFETTIKEQDLNITRDKEHIYLFTTTNHKPHTPNSHLQTPNSKASYPFDIFAASFYLLSRYEEYLPHKKDSYGRYGHENSVAFKYKFLDLPVINIWVKTLQKDLQKKFPRLQTNFPLFSFLPTYDIDIAYSFKSKGFFRNVGGMFRSIFRNKKPEVVSRYKTLRGIADDPFDVYCELDKVHNKYRLRPLYFFLAAEKNGRYDKNILPGKEIMQKLVYQTAEKYTIGLHPSWQSGDDDNILRKEKNILEEMIGNQIEISRQHYIRFDVETTFKKLIVAGIKEDHSMGYGSINGFRASVASSFNWFSLQDNQSTKLRIHPFSYMDANSLYEQKLTPAEALNEMIYYHNICKEYDGRFIGIWHNHLLGRSGIYKEWKEAYLKFLENISE